MEKNNVIITFKSHMYDTEEQIDMTAKGVHSIKDDVHYVRYNEETESGQSVRNILKFNGEFLEVTKIGTTKTKMYYKSGHTHKAIYNTPFGQYEMCIDTHKYTLDVSENKYKIVVEYDLQLGGVPVSKCTVEIAVESEE